MVDIRVNGDRLVATLTGWERVWALKSRVEVPVSQVERVFVDSVIARKPDGFRAPGAYWPGKISAGTYRRRGSKTFWSVRNPARAVIIDLHEGDYARLVLEVPDPAQTVAEIEAARRRGRTADS